MSQKQPKLKVINTRFWTFPGPELRTPRDAFRTMGGHWNVVMWLGTNMWMPLRSFQGNFGFHEKWTNEVFKSFSRQHKLCQSTRPRLQVTSAFIRTFWEKIWPGPKNSKNIPKTVKIEGYNKRFWSFLRPKLLTPRDASYGHWRSLKSSHVAWNEYVDAFTIISMQFWVSR